MPTDTESESPPHALTTCEFCGQEYDADVVDFCDCSVECWACGKIHPWRSSFVIEGNRVAYFYCDDCTIECADCGEVVLAEDSFEVEGDRYCCKCADECNECGRAFVISDLHEDEESHLHRLYCDRCSFQCAHCGDWFRRDNGYEVDGETWCEACTDYDARTCEECGTTTQHYEYCDELGASYCRECYRELPRCSECGSILDGEEICHECVHGNNSSIQPYNFKPAAKFLKVASETQFCGFELEVESDPDKCEDEVYDDANAVNGSFAGCYCKHDGSVEGFEIVTHPFSFDWLKQNEKSLASLLNNLKERNYKSAKAERCSCGLHIHTNRNTLSLVQQYKMAKFVYCNPQFVYVLSNRRLSRLNDYACPLQSDVRGSYTLATKLFRCKDVERYWALNLCPINTVEYRLFNGTLTFNTLMRAIEFVFSQVEFCKSTPIHRIGVPEYSAWLQDQPNFQRIAKFCVDNKPAFSLPYGSK